MDTRVGIVVVNWNETEVTLECLRSVLEAADSTTIVVIVDNASPDDPSARVTRELPHVFVLRLPHNGGYAAGCNAGAERAISLGATHLFFLNNDATIEPGTIPSLLSASAARPNAILGPKIVYANSPEWIWSAGGTVSRPWMQNAHVGRGVPSDAITEPKRVDWTTGCAMFVTVPTFRLLGPLDEKYFLYLEDLDWCLRGTRVGVDTWCVPESVVRHRVSRSTSLLPKAHVLYYGCRNTYRLAFRHNSARQAAAMWPAVLITAAKVIGRNLISSAHRRDPLYRARTRAILDFVRGRGGRLSVEV